MVKKILGGFILGSAVIWGSVIIAASLMMKGVENSAHIISILGTGSAIHLILIWVPLAARMKKILGENTD